GVSVLVASDPRGQANRRIRGHPNARVVATERLDELLLHVRNGVEEGALEVEEGVSDFIENARANRSDLVGVPEAVDPGGDPLPDAIACSRGKRCTQPRQLLADAVRVVEDAAPPRFRGMRGQHRPDFQLLQRRRHPLGRDALCLEARDRAVEFPRLLRRLGHRSRLPLQLGKIDELEVGRKCPDQPRGILQWNPAEFGDERFLLSGVVVLAELLGALPDRLLQLIERDALVLAQGLAKQLPEQPDLGAKTRLRQGRFGDAGAHWVTAALAVCRRILPVRTVESGFEEGESMPDPNGASPLKRQSARLTEGDDRAGARAMLRAIGFTREDLSKPLIGVGHSWIETMPCNFNHRRLAEKVKAGIRAAGGTPMEFNTIAVSDGVSMGTEGMKASLVSREVIADSIELVARGHLFDGLVLIVGCDKTIPAAVMALVRLNLPGLALYSGTIGPGRYRGRDITLQDVFEAVGAVAAGTMTRAELGEIEAGPWHGGGRCGGRCTANTTATAREGWVPLSIDDFDRVASRTPVVASLKPGGEYVAKDLHDAGGIRLVLRRLEEGGLINGDARTVDGRTIAQVAASAVETPGQ